MSQSDKQNAQQTQPVQAVQAAAQLPQYAPYAVYQVPPNGTGEQQMRGLVPIQIVVPALGGGLQLVQLSQPAMLQSLQMVQSGQILQDQRQALLLQDAAGTRQQVVLQGTEAARQAAAAQQDPKAARQAVLSPRPVSAGTAVKQQGMNPAASAASTQQPAAVISPTAGTVRTSNGTPMPQYDAATAAAAAAATKQLQQAAVHQLQQHAVAMQRAAALHIPQLQIPSTAGQSPHEAAANRPPSPHASVPAAATSAPLAATSPQMEQEAAEQPSQPTAHTLRVRQRQVWNLKRKFGELTSQIEGAMCEVGGLAVKNTAYHMVGNHLLCGEVLVLAQANDPVL